MTTPTLSHQVSSLLGHANLRLRSPFRRFHLNSIRFKFSVLYTVVLGVILVFFSTVLYVVLSYYLYQYVDSRLKLKALESVSTIRSYTDILQNKSGSLEFAVKKTFFYDVDYPLGIFDAGKIKRLESKWLERADVLDFNYTYTVFFSSDKQQVITSKNFPSQLLPMLLGISNLPVSPQEMTFTNIVYKKEPIRVLTMKYLTLDNKTYLVHMGASQKHLTQLRLSLLRSMALGIPLVLILTSFVGRLFVQRILDPIEEITKTANQITYKDLGSRVKSKHLDAEIAYLVESFNDMIMRLERSFKHINEFSSHVAHELKTPLAIIKGESELTLNKERTVEEYKKALLINLEEADRMRQTIENLLLLAKLDYQPEGFQFEVFDFMEFFREICEQAKILASDKDIAVTAAVPQESIFIKGDRLHLRRLFFNLIDNALKFTPSGGELRLRALQTDKKVTVIVSDTGVGIPLENLPNIFEKFYRLNQADIGTGLGLSIVQSIVKVHHGQIRVRSKINRGTSFRVTLPM